MNSIRLKLFNPFSKPYKPRIGDEKWNEYRQLLERLHTKGTSRVDMLIVLKQEHDFHPSLSQLISKLAEWGLKVYSKREATGNGHPGKDSAELDHKQTYTPNNSFQSPVLNESYSTSTPRDFKQIYTINEHVDSNSSAYEGGGTRIDSTGSTDLRAANPPPRANCDTNDNRTSFSFNSAVEDPGSLLFLSPGNDDFIFPQPNNKSFQSFTDLAARIAIKKSHRSRSPKTSRSRSSHMSVDSHESWRFSKVARMESPSRYLGTNKGQNVLRRNSGDPPWLETMYKPSPLETMDKDNPF